MRLFNYIGVFVFVLFFMFNQSNLIQYDQIEFNPFVMLDDSACTLFSIKLSVELRYKTFFFSFFEKLISRFYTEISFDALQTIFIWW